MKRAGRAWRVLGESASIVESVAGAVWELVERVWVQMADLTSTFLVYAGVIITWLAPAATIAVQWAGVGWERFVKLCGPMFDRVIDWLDAYATVSEPYTESALFAWGT